MLLLLYFVLFLPVLVYLLWHGLGLFLSTIVRRRRPCKSTLKAKKGKVALLYLTHNDFNQTACSSLLDQEGISTQLFILDDSTEPQKRFEIDGWVKRQSSDVIVVRRNTRQGFKGGNINNWLSLYGDEGNYPYLLIADADEYLPSFFSRKLLDCITSGEYAFAQACHSGNHGRLTAFQDLLGIQVDVMWFHQILARGFFASPPMFGHGVLIDTKILQKVGGFPDVVSEDIALSIRFSELGYRGLLTSHVVGYEEFPKNYAAYWKRRRRWIKADVEIIRRMFGRIWASSMSLPARLDLLCREFRLPLGSLYLILLLLISFVALFDLSPGLSVSFVWWTLLPVFALPILPAMSAKGLSMLEKVRFLLLMIFTGLSMAALSPYALISSILGQKTFESTGDTTNGNERAQYLIWEILCSSVIVAGGIASRNLSLVAVGGAMFTSPWLRSRVNVFPIKIAGFLFWTLIFVQILISFHLGEIPIEVLLALSGIVLMSI